VFGSINSPNPPLIHLHILPSTKLRIFNDRTSAISLDGCATHRTLAAPFIASFIAYQSLPHVNQGCTYRDIRPPLLRPVPILFGPSSTSIFELYFTTGAPPNRTYLDGSSERFRTGMYEVLLPACRSPSPSAAHDADSMSPPCAAAVTAFPQLYVSSIVRFSVFLLFFLSIESSIFHLSRFVLFVMSRYVLLSLRSLQHEVMVGCKR
jgi:hypothetical protein